MRRAVFTVPHNARTGIAPLPEVAQVLQVGQVGQYDEQSDSLPAQQCKHQQSMFPVLSI